MKIVKKNNRSLYRRLIAWTLFVLATGLYLLFSPNVFDTLPTYKVLSDILPAHAWGVAFILLGIALAFNISVGSKYSRIRIILVAIAALCIMWTVGLALSSLFTGTPSPFVIITYSLVSYFGIHFITEEPYGTNVANGINTKDRE